MAKLTKVDVLHIAKLAKLDLTDREVDKFASQLSNVIDYFSELSKVNTDGIDPISQTTGLENVYRVDKAQNSKSLSQDEAISGTDHTYNGYFRVKAILEGRTDK